jgi:hypothetical protein
MKSPGPVDGARYFFTNPIHVLFHFENGCIVLKPPACKDQLCCPACKSGNSIRADHPEAMTRSRFLHSSASIDFRFAAPENSAAIVHAYLSVPDFEDTAIRLYGRAGVVTGWINPVQERVFLFRNMQTFPDDSVLLQKIYPYK